MHIYVVGVPVFGGGGGAAGSAALFFPPLLRPLPLALWSFSTS